MSLSAHHQLAATRPSSRHPRQLFSLPVLWDGNRCWTLVHLLREFWPATAAPNQEATGTSLSQLMDSGGGGVGWLRVRGESSGRRLVLPPGAPGHRSQGGYPPGVVGTSHLFWLTLLAENVLYLELERSTKSAKCYTRAAQENWPCGQQWAGGVHSPAVPTTCDLWWAPHQAPWGCRQSGNPLCMPTPVSTWAAAMPVEGVQTSLNRQGPQRTERVIKIYKDILFILAYFIFLRKQLVLIIWHWVRTGISR